MAAAAYLKKLTLEDCQAFKENPSKNPITHRKINPTAKYGVGVQIRRRCKKLEGSTYGVMGVGSELIVPRILMPKVPKALTVVLMDICSTDLEKMCHWMEAFGKPDASMFKDPLNHKAEIELELRTRITIVEGGKRIPEVIVSVLNDLSVRHIVGKSGIFRFPRVPKMLRRHTQMLGNLGGLTFCRGFITSRSAIINDEEVLTDAYKGNVLKSIKKKPANELLGKYVRLTEIMRELDIDTGVLYVPFCKNTITDEGIIQQLLNNMHQYILGTYRDKLSDSLIKKIEALDKYAKPSRFRALFREVQKELAAQNIKINESMSNETRGYIDRARGATRL